MQVTTIEFATDVCKAALERIELLDADGKVLAALDALVSQDSWGVQGDVLFPLPSNLQDDLSQYSLRLSRLFLYGFPPITVDLTP